MSASSERTVFDDIADEVIDRAYDQFGAMTGCVVEDTDVTGIAAALRAAADQLDAATRNGERIRCGTCGSRFGEGNQCPAGCRDDVSWRVTPAQETAMTRDDSSS